MSQCNVFKQAMQLHLCAISEILALMFINHTAELWISWQGVHNTFECDTQEDYKLEEIRLTNLLNQYSQISV
jgi:hypothetical protein